jgi:hypothetical protein
MTTPITLAICRNMLTGPVIAGSDVLDAAVAAWTARRVARSEAILMPDWIRDRIEQISLLGKVTMASPAE